MLDHVLESRLWLPRPQAEVFAFFAEPAHLAVLTPPWLHFALVGTTPAVEAGVVLDYRVRWLGLPLRWRSMITEFDPPHRFVDVQLQGPYARWQHEHRFREAARDSPDPPGTWVEDRVAYRLPLGPLGRLVHRVLVRRQLEAIFAYRRQRLVERFGGGPAP